MARLTDDKKQDIKNALMLGDSQYKVSQDFEVSSATVNKIFKTINKEDILKEEVKGGIAIKSKLYEICERNVKESESIVKAFEDRIESELRRKGLVFNLTELTLKKATKLLKKNKKTILSKVDHFEDGKKIMTTMEEKEIPLTMTDYKESIELADKASLTLGVNQRHSNSQVQVNNTNAIQNNLITLTEDEALKEAERLGVPLSALI